MINRVFLLNQPIDESTKAEPEPPYTVGCKVSPMDINPELTNQPMTHIYKSPVVTLIFELRLLRLAEAAWSETTVLQHFTLLL